VCSRQIIQQSRGWQSINLSSRRTRHLDDLATSASTEVRVTAIRYVSDRIDVFRVTNMALLPKPLGPQIG
jgi:hypothetical protein